MICEHKWRNWPFSQDIVCIKCNYQIIGGIHYPYGNPKWTIPQYETEELEHKGMKFIIPKEVSEVWRTHFASLEAPK